jgi:hypothetical protein
MSAIASISPSVIGRAPLSFSEKPPDERPRRRATSSFVRPARPISARMFAATTYASGGSSGDACGWIGVAVIRESLQRTVRMRKGLQVQVSQRADLAACKTL